MSKTYTIADYVAAYPADIQGLIGLALDWKYSNGLTPLENVLTGNDAFRDEMFSASGERDKVAANAEQLNAWMSRSDTLAMPVAYRDAFAELKGKLAAYTFDPITHAERIMAGTPWLLIGGAALGLWYLFFRKR